MLSANFTMTSFLCATFHKQVYIINLKTISGYVVMDPGRGTYRADIANLIEKERLVSRIPKPGSHMLKPPLVPVRSWTPIGPGVLDDHILATRVVVVHFAAIFELALLPHRKGFDSFATLYRNVFFELIGVMLLFNRNIL
jgi:hypothetical protein